MGRTPPVEQHAFVDRVIVSGVQGQRVAWLNSDAELDSVVMRADMVELPRCEMTRVEQQWGCGLVVLAMLAAERWEVRKIVTWPAGEFNGNGTRLEASGNFLLCEILELHALGEPFLIKDRGLCITIQNPGGFPEPGVLNGRQVAIDGVRYAVRGVESFAIGRPYPERLNFALLVSAVD